MNGEELGKPIHILVVEDNPDNIELTREALRDSKLPLNFSSIGNGEEVMECVQREGKYTQIALSDLILRDFNLTQKNGYEVPKEV